jgi:hypothetical protein
MTRIANLTAILWVSGMVLAACPAVDAATAPPPTAAQVKAVIDCRAISDDAARLACFDKAVADMSAAEKSGELLTLDREQRRAVRRESFGLTLPSFDIFNRGEKPEEANQLTAHVASASLNAERKWLIRLDDGALWEQTDDYDLNHGPHAGSTVVIFKGLFGSFFMKVDGQQAIRAKRVH